MTKRTEEDKERSSITKKGNKKEKRMARITVGKERKNKNGNRQYDGRTNVEE